MSFEFALKTEGCDYYCAYCGEVNSTFVDPSQGTTQQYIEDCQVCCRPNVLNVSYDEWQEEFMIRADVSE
jgi:hypothetical protein